jgi:hypothetical protein
MLPLGVYGAPASGVVPAGGDSFRREFEMGTITRRSIGVPMQETVYAVDVFIAAIKCFGSEDEGGPLGGGEGVDEPYVIVTTINPAHVWFDGNAGNVVKSWRSPVFSNIGKGTIFGMDQEVFKNLFLGRHGPLLKIALFDQEHGDPETLRAEIEAKGRALVQEGLAAAAALAGASVDQGQAEQAMDSEFGKLIQDLTFDTLTDLLKDDKIGENTWLLEASMLKEWVDTGFTANSDIVYPPEELPPHIGTNFPRKEILDPTWLFSGGGGTYKIYLRLIPHKDTVEF